MRFHDPAVIGYLLALVLVLGFFFYLIERSYRKTSARFAEKEMLAKLTAPYRDKFRIVRAILDITAVILIGLAIARPQWGALWKQKPPDGIDILFALDMSKSMLARDIQPDRLSYAKREIISFVEDLEGDRVGLVGFSGDAFFFCPITPDRTGFFDSLENAGIESIERGGTSIEAAITEGIKALSSAYSDKVLILISDGEATEGDAVQAADAAKKAGVEIDCIGIGTTEGIGINYVDEKKEQHIVKDQSGHPVTAKLDEVMLESVAAATGGIYVHAAPGNFGLEKIYKERLSKIKKRQADESLLRTYQEQFQYFLILAFGALLISMIISMSAGYEKN